MGLLSRSAKTGLYDLHESSMVYCELLAMQTGLDLFFESIDHILLDFGLSSPKRLQEICVLFGIPMPKQLNASQQIAAVLALAAGCGHSSESAENYCNSLGTPVVITEQPESHSLDVRISGETHSLTINQIVQLLEIAVPPGITIHPVSEELSGV